MSGRRRRRGYCIPDVKYHYMRIRPPAKGEPFHNDQLASGDDPISITASRGRGTVFEAREVIDGGFLELVRYGIRRADDPLIVDSLKVIDHCLKIETPFGVCWRRYNHDGYGQKKDGGPYDGSGQGRAWPILTGERGHYELAAGGDDVHSTSRRLSSSVRSEGCFLSRFGTMTTFLRGECTGGGPRARRNRWCGRMRSI